MPSFFALSVNLPEKNTSFKYHFPSLSTATVSFSAFCRIINFGVSNIPLGGNGLFIF
jgi:hypothetical protein